MIIFSNTKYFKTVSLIQEIKRFSEYILQKDKIKIKVPSVTPEPP